MFQARHGRAGGTGSSRLPRVREGGEAPKVIGLKVYITRRIYEKQSMVRFGPNKPKLLLRPVPRRIGLAPLVRLVVGWHGIGNQSGCPMTRKNSSSCGLIGRLMVSPV